MIDLPLPLVDVVQYCKPHAHYEIQVELKYATDDNFLGRVVKGYDARAKHLALLTPQAAEALCRVQKELNEKYNYGVLIYDAYRPKQSVLDFVDWAKAPIANQRERAQKVKHYPDIEKSQLFDLGYVAEDSEHCYGHTVDLVLINIKNNQLLDMGSQFDFMGERSHLDATASMIGETALHHREILQSTMKKYGFEPYEKEYWHFSFHGKAGRGATHPFNVPITLELQGLGVKQVLEETA